MLRSIILNRDDIVTSPMGLNVMITVPGENFHIVLNPDAAVEFARDIQQLIPGGFDGTNDLTIIMPEGGE